MNVQEPRYCVPEHFSALCGVARGPASAFPAELPSPPPFPVEERASWGSELVVHAALDPGVGAACGAGACGAGATGVASAGPAVVGTIVGATSAPTPTPRCVRVVRRWAISLRPGVVLTAALTNARICWVPFVFLFLSLRCHPCSRNMRRSAAHKDAPDRPFG